MIVQVLRRSGRRTPAAAAAPARRAGRSRRGPEPQVGDHLIVAAAGGVQLAADVAEPLDQRLLDVHVDVFQLGAQRKLALLQLPADLPQCLLDLPALLGRQQADLGQHLGVGDRAGDVVCDTAGGRS